MPDLFKVGLTQNTPNQRTIQLTKAGVSSTFEVEYYAKVGNVFSAEERAYQNQMDFHYNKEFFKSRYKNSHPLCRNYNFLLRESVRHKLNMI